MANNANVGPELVQLIGLFNQSTNDSLDGTYATSVMENRSPVVYAKSARTVGCAAAQK